MADPNPTPAPPPSQEPQEPSATTASNGNLSPPNAQNAPKSDARSDDAISPREAAMREAIDKLRLALPALENADKSLSSHIDTIVRQASDPIRLNQQSFQHDIAYAIEDATKILGTDRLALSHAATSEISRLAASAPGLNNEHARNLLEHTAKIGDPNLVRDIRNAGADIGRQADQDTPAIRSRLETLESRARLAPRVETVAESTPASAQPPTSPPDAPTTQATESRQRQDRNLRQPQNNGSFLPGVSTNAVQDGVFRALRSRGPFDTPPWEAGAQPFAERLTAFEAQLKQGKEDITMRGAERSGRAAMEAMEGFRTGEGAVIMNRIREAARTDPNGMAGVLSEMKDGGKFADLRQQFNNTLVDEKGVTAAYDKAAAALARYGEDRKAVEQIIARRPDAANLAAKFEAMDKEIGQAAGELPSRRDGKTMLEDLSRQVAEMLQKAVDSIKNLFHRGPSASVSPSSPSPS